ncbi:DUF4419 domain-containing protein [Polyangium jinanense]|uniref:DUF4419 domain-containing protein n=1 Tax=Polyangium jinanense TaxID=2829994 RepID=UPI0023418839|nr:DUF4419 domain-containing protein [Polyangium jinanense]
MPSLADPDLPVVDHGPTHALLGAVHLAFAQHRPLVLSPDAVWLTIAQGVAPGRCPGPRGGCSPLDPNQGQPWTIWGRTARCAVLPTGRWQDREGALHAGDGRVAR